MRFHRKTNPRVVDGKVQRKNRWSRREPDYTNTHQIRVERSRASKHYRHFVSITDVSAFLALLPDWRELSIGLQRILLSNATAYDGWFRPGTVAICNWEACRTRIMSPGYYMDHVDLFRRLRVPCRRGVLSPGAYCPSCYATLKDDDWMCSACGSSIADAFVEPTRDSDRSLRYIAEFDDLSIHAFLLVHVLVHELGHHHDRMTSPGRRDCTRGESYAEAYAHRYEDRIWPAYCRVFGWR